MWSALPSISLEELIAAAPVERGLYLAQGTHDMSALVLKKLVELMDVEASPLEPAADDMRSARLSYSPYRYWRRNSRIGQLIWLDSGHTFDASCVAGEARRRRLDPTRILRAIKVDRPFTAHQLQQMLERVPNPALWAPTSAPQTTWASVGRPDSVALKSSSAMWWTPFVVVSDLMALFCDPSISENALVPAFRSFIMRMAYLRQRAIVLGFVDEQLVPPERRHFLAELVKLARPVSSEVCVA